ncbi:MAG TPA: hypothetical protein VFW96_08625 [Thermomicrobiales bacterium]|nr:hypothetical protein [Thermomicrobiales bacterium]
MRLAKAEAPPGAAAGAWSRRLAAALLVAALALLLLKLPATVAFSRAILAYPFQVDDSEGVILSEAQWLARGVDPYQPARPDLFTAAPYTPIFTALNAAAFAVAPFTFKVGRGLALLATLAVAALAALLVRRRTGSALLALWAGLAILTLNLVTVWSVRARPDELALACNLAGLAVVWWRWPAEDAGGAGRPRRDEWRALALAAGLCALGFYTKQTLLAAPLAAGLYLLLRRPRLGVAFGALYAALVAVPFVALDLATRHGFYQHIVAFHSSWAAADYLRLARPFVARYWPLLAAAALLPLAVVAGGARLRRDPDLLPALYLPLAALGSLGAGTHGGNHNHFVETLVAAALCAALLAGRLAARGATGRVAAAALVLLLSVASVAEARLAPADWLARDYRAPLPAEREGWAQLAAFVTNDPGPVYSDNVGLLLVAGKPVDYTDPFTLAYAAETGQWDQRALVGRIERGEFHLIALRYDVFAVSGAPTDLTPEMLAAIRAHYRLIQRNVVFVYAPR